MPQNSAPVFLLIKNLCNIKKDPGGDIIYSNYSNGNPKEIIAPDNSRVSMSYDEYGHQTLLTDPDAGTIRYDYNAFAEMIDQKDAKGNHFTMTYDKLGRLLTKTCPEDGTVTTNTYYPSTAINAKGLLSSTSHSNKTSFSYLYDNYSRIIQKTEHANQDFNYFYTYDPYGNLQDYQFPSGFTISHTYENGYMKRVVNSGDGTSIFAPKDYTVRGQLRWWDNGAGDIIHTFNEFDQFGFPTNVQCGINMGTWNIQNLETHFNSQTGNMEYRKDKNFMYNGFYLTENFTYDNVHKNRLASWERNGQLPDITNMTYGNDNGNILTKSDITSAGNPYTYDGANKPHAVQSITSPLQLPAEALQNITYNRFNKVEEITHGNQGLRLNITYGPDEQRIKSEFYTNDVLNKTKYFIGGDYEVEKLPNGSERRIHYLPGEGIYVSNELGTGQMYYAQTDYQGNWSSVTDATGNVLERYSFDPWGCRRNPIDWSFNNVPTTFLFDRGYTGHEMLDDFGLINMNGRVYDPVMARFMSPDNYVQAPDNSQGFNRYSYCLNNPLKYSDPSGDFAILAAVTAGIYNWAAHGSEFSWKGLGYFGIGALASGAGAFVGEAVGGALGTATTFGGAVMNGAIIGASGGFAGGFVGGAGNAWLNGDNFGQGLQAGLIGGGYGAFGGVLIGGVTGGIQFQKQMYLFSKGCLELGVDAGEPVPATDDFLHQSQEAWYKDAPMNKIRKFTVENVPKNLFTKDLENAGAAVQSIFANNKVTGFSDVYFNKNVAFSSAKQLYFRMGHEFVHVSQYAALVGYPKSFVNQPNFKKLMEFHAYNFQNSIGGTQLSAFPPNSVRQLMTQFPKYFNMLNYTNFDWTFNIINPF